MLWSWEEQDWSTVGLCISVCKVLLFIYSLYRMLVSKFWIDNIAIYNFHLIYTLRKYITLSPSIIVPFVWFKKYIALFVLLYSSSYSWTIFDLCSHSEGFHWPKYVPCSHQLFENPISEKKICEFRNKFYSWNVGYRSLRNQLAERYKVQ